MEMLKKLACENESMRDMLLNLVQDYGRKIETVGGSQLDDPDAQDQTIKDAMIFLGMKNRVREYRE